MNDIYGLPIGGRHDRARIRDYRLANAISVTLANVTSNDLDLNNQANAGFGIARLTSTGAANTINGLIGGKPGRVILIENVDSAQNISFAHRNASSLANNQIDCPNALTYLLRPGQIVELVYDDTQAFWKLNGPAVSVAADANVTIDAVATAGTGGTAAASGHGHQVVTTDAPSGAAITIDSAPSAAATGAVARAAHGHQVSTGGATPAVTTATALGAGGATGAIARQQHVHQSVGNVARRITSVAIANTETVVVSYTAIPTGVINNAGVLFRFGFYGNLTTGATPGTGTFRVRIGPTTLTGVIPVSLALAQTASVTAGPFAIEGLVVVRTTGATGTAIGQMWLDAQNGAVPIAFTAAAVIVAVPTATVTADFTLSTNKFELTYISGQAGSTATFEQAFINIDSMA